MYEIPVKPSDAVCAHSLSLHFIFSLPVRVVDSSYKTSAFCDWPNPQLPLLLDTILLGLAYFFPRFYGDGPHVDGNRSEASFNIRNDSIANHLTLAICKLPSSRHHCFGHNARRTSYIFFSVSSIILSVSYFSLSVILGLSMALPHFPCVCFHHL